MAMTSELLQSSVIFLSAAVVAVPISSAFWAGFCAWLFACRCGDWPMGTSS